MRLAKKDVNLLLVVLGILVFLAAYFLVYSSYTDKTAVLQGEIDALRPRLTELREHERKIPEYNAGIEQSKAFIDGELADYAETVRTEDFIMYAVSLEEDSGLDISSATFTEPWTVLEFPLMRDGVEHTYTARGVNMSINCRMTYTSLKRAIDKLYTTPKKTLLDSVNVSYDAETGGLTGSMTIVKAFVNNGFVEYVPADVPGGNYGVSDPFGTINVIAVPGGEEPGGEQPPAAP